MRATDHVRPCPLLVGFEALPRKEAVGPMLKQPLERGRRPRPASGRVLTPVAVRAWPTVRSREFQSFVTRIQSFVTKQHSLLIQLHSHASAFI